MLSLLDASCALFLDFDGTLVELAARPDLVQVPAGLPTTLRALAERLGGALAVVSGRPVDELDAFLAPLRLPAAGVHGAERRAAHGRPVTALGARADVRAALEEVVRHAGALAVRHPGLLLETKPGAVALHYREAPHLEALCLETMQRAVCHPALSLLHGKMVLEAKPVGATKGAAIAAFMEEPPFAGRRPVFAGDDVTDEAGFAAVQALGGVAIKVGPGVSIAQQRLDGPQALQRWLQASLSSLAHAAPTRDESIDPR